MGITTILIITITKGKNYEKKYISKTQLKEILSFSVHLCQSQGQI